jgi:hypothetical protein
VIDLTDRSSSLLDLACGYAHAKEARGWGWAPAFGRIALVRATFKAEMQAHDSRARFTTKNQGQSSGPQQKRLTAIRYISS